jgi:outer membrane protein assembly factor BamA
MVWMLFDDAEQRNEWSCNSHSSIQVATTTNTNNNINININNNNNNSIIINIIIINTNNSCPSISMRDMYTNKHNRSKILHCQSDSVLANLRQQPMNPMQSPTELWYHCC